MLDQKPAVGQDVGEPRAQELFIPARESGQFHDIVEAFFVAGLIGAQGVASWHVDSGRRTEQMLWPDHPQLFFLSFVAHAAYPLIPEITIPCKKVRWVTKKMAIGTSVETTVIAIRY